MTTHEHLTDAERIALHQQEIGELVYAIADLTSQFEALIAAVANSGVDAEVAAPEDGHHLSPSRPAKVTPSCGRPACRSTSASSRPTPPPTP